MLGFPLRSTDSKAAVGHTHWSLSVSLRLFCARRSIRSMGEPSTTCLIGPVS